MPSGPSKEVGFDWSETMGFLVLSRRKDESVLAVVNGKVIAKVLLVDVRGDKSRIGFEADDSIKFYRNEVWERMLEEKTNANSTGIEPSGTGSTPS